MIQHHDSVVPEIVKYHELMRENVYRGLAGYRSYGSLLKNDALSRPLLFGLLTLDQYKELGGSLPSPRRQPSMGFLNTRLPVPEQELTPLPLPSVDMNIGCIRDSANLITAIPDLDPATLNSLTRGIQEQLLIRAKPDLNGQNVQQFLEFISVARFNRLAGLLTAGVVPYAKWEEDEMRVLLPPQHARIFPVKP
jgi:hypothetical protein